MKRKLLLAVVIMAVLLCLFAVSVSAVETIDGLTYDFAGSPKTARLTNANKACTLETVIIPETVTASDGIAYTVTEIYQSAFEGNKAIKYLSLPSTITKISPAAFKDCTNLLFVDFNDNQNDIDFNNWGHFFGCTSLKAVSMPDNVDYITNRMFAKCTSLQAVYLPSATVTIESNGYGDSGAFSACNNMYFVNEPFDVRDENGDFYTATTFDMPERPDVYFFPSNLQKLYDRDNGVGFSQCYSLNPVMVMPTSLTKMWINDGVFYECGATGNTFTIVFLADMTDVRIGMRENRAKGISYVFANSADKTLNDVNIVDTSPSYTPNFGGTETIYFCHSNKSFKLFNLGGANDDTTYTETNVATKYVNSTVHIANPNKSTTVKPTCITAGYTEGECFCGAGMDRVNIDPTNEHIYGTDYDCTTAEKCIADENCTEYSTKNDAHNIIHTLEYVAFDQKGTYNHYCNNDGCTMAGKEIRDGEKDAIIISKGYSTPENINVKGINAGFEIKKDLLDLYNDLNNDASFTLFMVNSQIDGQTISKILNGETLELESGVKGVNVKISSVNYTSLSVEVRGFDDSEGGNFYTLNLITAIAVKTDDGIHYVQAKLQNSANTTVEIDGVEFNIVTANNVYNPTAQS